MKNWSFGKLIGVFAGSFLALIVLAVVVIKATSSPAAKAKRVTQSQAQMAQPARMDVLSIELAKSREQAQAALQAQENSEKQLKIVREESQRSTQLLLSQIKALDTTLSSLQQRMGAYENSRQHVEVIKPPRTTWHGTPLHELWLRDPTGYQVELYARLTPDELAQMPEDKRAIFLVPGTGPLTPDPGQ